MIKTEIDGVEILDFRMEPSSVPGWKGGVRSWDEIEGVLLHQSSGPSIYIETWRRLNTHIAVQRDGRILLLQPFERVIWHGHGLSSKTIGLEIEGNFLGDEGNPDTWYKKFEGPHNLTPEQKKSLEILFEILSREFYENGKALTRIYAHRQSCVDRQADPGQEIWREVAIPWALALGIYDGQEYHGGPLHATGSGLPIPRNWDPQSKSKY